MKSYFLLFSLISTFLIADDIREFSRPKELRKKEIAPSPSSDLSSSEEDCSILISNAQGLILLGDPKLLQRNPPPVIGVKTKDLDIPGGERRLIQRLIPLFYQRDLSQKTINEIKRTIVLYYREQNHPVMMVFVPEQPLKNGVLQIVILESRVCNVNVSGNRYVKEDRIRKLIRLKPGDQINEKKLLQDVSWINMDPFRSANILFSPGSANGTTDVTIKISDRKPWRIYAGGDNTGSPYTGEARWFTGFNVENTFFPENLLSFQFMTSSDFHKFKSYTLQYVIPFSWRNTLSVFGGYAIVHPHLTGFTSEGKSYQVSGRYDIPIWPAYPNYPQQFTLGFDFKATNNNLVFGTDNLLVQSSLVNLGQFVFGYHFSMDRPRQKIASGIDVFWSPGEMLPHQSNAVFHTLNPNADARYIYAKLFYNHEAALPKSCSLFWQTRLQLSGSSLISSEQFGLGGYNTVRGYRERSVNGDNGVCLNFEARSPSISPLYSRYSRLPRDALYFLGFCDFGYAWDHHKIPGLPLTQTLIGVGPGLRYRIGSIFNFRLDIGFPLHQIQATSEKIRFHMSGVLNY